MRRKMIKLFFIILIIVLFIGWQNNHIVIREISYKNPKIPNDFREYKIVHISDLHNKEFGKNQKRLLKKVEKASPDIIVITGDLIDRRRYNLDTAIELIEGGMKIAPIYYVSGNHEAWSGKYEEIKDNLSDLGVEILDDRKIELIKNGGKIEILGLADPAFFTKTYREENKLSKLEKNLKDMSDDSIFQILLCHRPELFDIYIDENIDLIFSGHAHGGQFRIPFLGGLLAPGQGFFPKYTSGIYREGKSSLLVSRGLGNSIVPIRIFNRPEIIVLTLEN